MSADPLAGLDFSQALADVKKGMVLKPLLQTYFNNGQFPDHTMEFKYDHDLDHGPDGWFHPSTHPLWNPRQLYTYITRPDLIRREKMDYTGVLSVTIGSAMHSFIQNCMRSMGLLPADLQKCHDCPPARQCTEPGFSNPELRERGHLDGILELPNRPRGSDIFEFKTTGPNTKLSKVDDMDLAGFIKAVPYYYHQQLAYQRLSGRRNSIIFVMTLGYPWPMKEFHIPFDLAESNQVVNKYRDVIQRAADQRPPLCGCTKSVKSGCPAAGMCAIL